MSAFSVMTWVIIGGFVATLVVTLAGLIGWVRFVKPSYLDRLFKVLVLEIVALGISVFTSGMAGSSQYFRQVETLYADALAAKGKGDVDGALQKLQSILQVSDDALPFKLRSVFLQRANIAYERNLWSQASESYAIYLELNPNDVDALVRAGKALRELNMYERAQALYERARNLDSQNWEVLNGLQNCLRRLGSFYMEAGRTEVADKLYEQARTHILAMRSIARGHDAQRYKTAELALARLEWQREHYREAIAKFSETLQEFPDLQAAREDLAQVKLEFGEKINDPRLIDEARTSYRQLYIEAKTPELRVYPGAGLAEATANSSLATEEDLKFATDAVSLAIANNQYAKDDPFAMYASALLLKRLGQTVEAVAKLKEAIRLENQRRSDPYTLDYVRLIKYEGLLQTWTGKT